MLSRSAAAVPGLVEGVDAADAGAGEVAAGADDAASGGASLRDGTASLVDGADQVDAGAQQLASGLAEATAQIPAYSDDDIDALTGVVSEPVVATRTEIPPGQASVPFFGVLALWIGGLVIALARKAAPTAELLGPRRSLAIARDAVWPAAAVGAGQGLLIGVALTTAVAVDPPSWLGFTAAAIGIGAVFAVLQQGIAAAFGGPGRFAAVLVAAIALAAGLSSTVPGILATTAAALPTTPAADLLLGALSPAGGPAMPAILTLLLWAAVGFLGTLAGVARRRTVVPRTLAIR
ncbi:hypothetical protein [Agromyces seonyuensis]|uniref:ABC transporter permease n=1 Tax=Agromyces seonyuensis TaxID=2662446 RepID=A0A6I4P0P5_9MICO|nr:hypothetical protein [Agromyces seonyuensis]MWC00171.1 hypothetical protein [Agromyces seonyuensis]